MSAIIGWRGRVYRLSVVELGGTARLYVNDSPVEHYPHDLQALAYQRARGLGLI
jgi:hypothetical protein